MPFCVRILTTSCHNAIVIATSKTKLIVLIIKHGKAYVCGHKPLIILETIIAIITVYRDHMIVVKCHYPVVILG